MSMQYESGQLDLDLFMANFSGGVPVKDDLASMEFPLFSLGKKPDLRIREFIHPLNGKKVKIIPSVAGAANVFDKDLLIFVASQLIEAKKNNWPISKKVKIPIHSFIKQTQRSDGGKSYTDINNMLIRLKGTTIETNVPTGNVTQTKGFGWIDDYEITQYTRNKKGIQEVVVTISDFLYNSIKTFEVLTISQQYFALGQPLERRLYELARKHVGRKAVWKCDLDLLRLKCGTTQELYVFRKELRAIIARDALPGFRIALDTTVKKHKAVFYTRDNEQLIKDLSEKNLIGWFEALERGGSSSNNEEM